MKCSFSYNSFIKFNGLKNEPQSWGHNMTVLYPICIILRCVIKGLHCIMVTQWKWLNEMIPISTKTFFSWRGDTLKTIFIYCLKI